MEHKPTYSEEEILPVQPLPMPIPPKPFDQSDSDDEGTQIVEHPL